MTLRATPALQSSETLRSFCLRVSGAVAPSAPDQTGLSRVASTLNQTRLSRSRARESRAEPDCQPTQGLRAPDARKPTVQPVVESKLVMLPISVTEDDAADTAVWVVMRAEDEKV